jgi:SM-20-related protein
LDRGALQCGAMPRRWSALRNAVAQRPDRGITCVPVDGGRVDPSCVEGLHTGLVADGLAVQDGFLSQLRVRELIGCAEHRRARGDFSPARVGAEQRLQRRAEIRGDLACWFCAPLFAAERALLSDLEQLRLNLNRQGFLGLFDLELHYAWYPPGAGYARHVDQLQDRDERVVSLVLYLNDAWHPDAGGELRVFDHEGVRDIEPIAGRLVCFLSAGREHAVLPTRRGRLSISGWFRRRS